MFRTHAIAAGLGAVAITLTSCAHSSVPGQVITATSQAVQSHTFTPVAAAAVSAPVPVPATDGKYHMAYELLLTNVLGQEVTLTSLTVMAGDRSLLNLTGDQLGHWTRVMGAPGVPTTRLGPGQAALVWLDVASERSGAAGQADVPANLSHTIGVAVAQPMPPLLPTTMTETVAPVTVQTRKPAVIRPPLYGPRWLDGDSCCEMDAHRMALNPIDGQLWAAERFAIDYVQLDAQDRMFAGEKTKLDSYAYYGADVHAVADGSVVHVVDGRPEQVPGTSPSGLHLDEYGGNYIVEDVGGGNYAFYAHLKTASTKVRVGDQLKAGQVIAAVGNTGNSDAPHLHFHIMSTPDPLHSDGLPFVFSSFKLEGRLASMTAVDRLLDGTPAQLQAGFDPHDETDVSPLVLDMMNYAR
ncbi:M23 family metallopeptidase [Mycobacterium haemophilum]|uniref:Peptidase M23 n=1 Tax=Mycobacterium haemophilum TaxID=29311 RepID=A0A0I9UPX0_9MYCO|nr:M23 family metallopeptidase [Mycobacterium haemophilum]KLO32343.1 peptidase M23 [Mycobacterium haemophilum]KLO38556.1 peptidase M23 [Mycobacterium haemophilum]KLO44891.1 peptidase M23 [Mycobacterium haemophilum]KLO56233.1 peptidase M23 [Mycobacterium haemophilum]